MNGTETFVGASRCEHRLAGGGKGIRTAGPPDYDGAGHLAARDATDGLWRSLEHRSFASTSSSSDFQHADAPFTETKLALDRIGVDAFEHLTAPLFALLGISRAGPSSAASSN